jgi:hypothetical protein
MLNYSLPKETLLVSFGCMKKTLIFLLLALSHGEIFTQGVWTQKADLGGIARQGAVAFSIGSKGYIGTGTGQNGFLDDFWEWDQVSNTWTQKANFGGGQLSGAIGFSIGDL